MRQSRRFSRDLESAGRLVPSRLAFVGSVGFAWFQFFFCSTRIDFYLERAQFADTRYIENFGRESNKKIIKFTIESQEL